MLCTRPSLFHAAKQSVAAKYLPTHQHRQSRNASHIEACTNAAREITKLTQHLLLTNQSAILVDYHFAFNAAIVLELASLLDNGQEVADSIIVLAQYLQKAGQQGNESAADCARIVSEFGDVVARLKSQTTNGQTSTSMALGVGSVGGNTNNTEALETQEEQSATYDELFSWFTENLT
jgi:hypothetical protein